MSVQDGKAVVSEAIPHGVEWEEVLPTITLTPKTVAKALRKAGYFDTHDLRTRPSEVAGVISSLLRLNANTIISLVEDNSNG